MRPLALALLLAVLSLAPAAAQEKPPEVRLPFAPWAKAKTGDWEALTMRMTVANEPGKIRKVVVVYRVKEATDAKVSVGLETVPAQPRGPAPPASHDRNEPPLLGELLNDKLPGLANVTTTDDKKTIGGRTFDCKKITFTTKRTIELKASEPLVTDARYSVWISPEVKGSGIVAVENRSASHGGGIADDESSLDFELAGFGAEDAAEWGKKPADVDLSSIAAPRVEPTKLPLDPFGSAKEGDWQVLVQTLVADDGSVPFQRIVHTIRITKVSDQKIVYSAETRTRDGTKTGDVEVVREGLSLETFGNIPEGEVSDVSFADVEQRVGEKTFKAKKISYRQRHLVKDANAKRLSVIDSRNVIVLSAEMPARGFIRLDTTTEASGGPKRVRFKQTIEVVGYGSGDAVTWGKKGAEVDLAAEK